MATSLLPFEEDPMMNELPPGTAPDPAALPDIPLDIVEEEPTQGPSPEELEKAVEQLVKDYEEDDRAAHERISSECRKYELYWQNIQDIIWDSTSRDWVSASGVLQTSRNLDIDPSILDKTIGIYRAYGEIVASALAQTTPSVRFPPNDADNGSDIVTARTSNAIAELIQKHNDAPLLFLKALYIKFNQHFIAAYHTVVTDDSFGTVSRPQVGMKDEQVPTGEMSCPDCGTPTDPMMAMEGCPCGSVNPPIPEETTEQVPYIKEILEQPRGRIRIEVFGPRHVKVQPFTKEVGSSPYLILETDLHENLIKELYDKYTLAGVGDEADIRRSDRTPTVDNIDSGKVHTLKRCWLRPWALNGIKDEDIRNALRSAYPKGIHVAIVDKEVLEMSPESMDEHWTFVGDPFAEYIHGDPRGKFLVPLQDMFNDSETLALETILHNIPEMYADPAVLDFKKYSSQEARPGQVNQAKAPEGQALSSGFFQPQGATLSKEVDSFLQRLQEMAQFVIGAPPSIYGGTQSGGSSTLGEYQQSRAQAQQRLGTDWRMLNRWWANIMTKAVKEFREFTKSLAAKVNDPAYAEHFVKKDGENYTNVWIRLEEMTGETGEAEAESSDQFPISYEQQRGLLFEIMQSPNQTLAGMTMNPENIGAVRDIIGLYKLKIPGEQDRDKQLAEIAQMLNGMPVEIEQFIDNHQVQLMTCQSWALSPTGRDTKLSNPQGYQLVLQHAMMHYTAVQQMMEPPPEEGGGQSGDSPAEDQGSSQPPSTGGAKGEPPE